jgi:hypothetical protein
MPGVACISGRDQPLVEAILAAARFVSGNKQYGLPGRIEGECYAPNATGGLESKLFQIGVFRPLQGIHLRTSKLRSIDFEKLDASENRILNRFVEKQELLLELVRQPNDSRHQYSLKAINFKSQEFFKLHLHRRHDDCSFGKA